LQNIMFVGLDVHKATISVALAQGERGGEVRHWGTIPNRADHLRKLSDKLGSDGRQLPVCHEAGPCGDGLHRQLTELGHDCVVIAPSRVPVKAGDRVKTDRRDALMLAKLHRAGELTAVRVRDAAHEAMRDLVRAQATSGRVTGKVLQHLQGFGLRHGRIYPGKKGWTKAYPHRLTTVRFEHPARLCCTNSMRDSSCESSVVAGRHEQTHTPRLQDQELAGLECSAQAPWLAGDLV